MLLYESAENQYIKINVSAFNKKHIYSSFINEKGFVKKHFKQQKVVLLSKTLFILDSH